MKTHIVHKINLQIPAPNYEKAKELQGRAENWAENEFPNILNQSLDNIRGGEELLFIDKIEIEIPDLPWTLTEQQWKKKIQTEILEAKLIKLPFEVIFQEWLFFIKSGSFQSQSVFKDKRNLENHFFKHLAEWETQSPILLNEVFSSPDKIKRLFHHFTCKFVEEILLKAFSISVEEANILYHFFQKNLLDNSVEKKELIQNAISILQNAGNQKRKELFKIIKLNPKKQNLEKVLINKNAKEDLEKEKERTDPKLNLYFNCPNAGLVILLPYFLPLLQNLGMLKEKQFKDEAAQLRSLQIIHFLATGASEPEEEDLVLPKILCGFEIHDFVLIEGELDELTKKECLLLIESVIEHWEVLKNTSVEGLRTSFLQRNGRLKIEDHQYEVEVENSGIDILLDKVPWGFRNIKLPWMEKPILIQWY